MIVKNEEEDIPRCLKSVKPYIDYYLISDTGSTDNTVEVIRECLEGVPGEVLRHEWKDFGHNRELILQEAYKNPDIDYCLFIDADDELFVNNGAFNNLTADCYMIEQYTSDDLFRIGRPDFVNIKNVEWHWKGIVHNYLSGKPKSVLPFDGYIQQHMGNGGKSSGISSLKEKLGRDIELIEEALAQDPDNPRFQFYLAQAYRGLEENEKAYENYVKRIKLNGSDQEQYWCLLQIAMIRKEMDDKFPLGLFLAAYNYRPSRKEAIYEIAHHCVNSKLYPAAYMFAKTGYDLPRSKDLVFVNRRVEDWQMADVFTVAAYYTGRYQEAKDVCNALLLSGKLPESQIERVTVNRNAAIKMSDGCGADEYDSIYNAEPYTNRYDKIYKKVGSWAEGKVLDMACGTGRLSEYIADYKGFDFSPKAIEIAGYDSVWLGNAYTENLEGYDTYILLEVLEHLDDLRVLRRIPSGTNIIFSVPSFLCEVHLRAYTEDIIRDRFSEFIDIQETVRFNWDNRWVEGGTETDSYILLGRGVRT